MASVVEDFIANNVLNVLHNSFRARGGNIFTLPVDIGGLLAGNSSFEIPSSPQEILNSEEASYYIGLFTSSLAMLIFFVVWIVVLPYTCCCKCEQICPNVVKLSLLTLALILSMLGWFLSIRGNSLLTGGAQGLLDDAESAGSYITEVADVIGSLVDASFQFDTQVAALQVNCSVEAQAGGFDGTLASLPAGQDMRDVLEPLQSQIAGIEPQISNAAELVSPYLDQVATTYKTVTSVIISFLGIFGLTAIIRVMVKKQIISEESFIAKLVKCVSKFQLLVLCTLGLLFIILTWIFCIIFAPFATLGADICTPDITSNILAIVADAARQTGSPADMCFLDASSVGNVDPVLLAGNAVCYYTTCQGSNLAFETFGIVINGSDVQIDLVDEFLAQFTQIQDDVNSFPSSGNGCVETLNETIDFMNEVVDQIKSGILLAGCENITPLLRDVTDNQVCNGLISGVGVIFITWCCGAVGLMLTICCFCCLDLSAEEYEENDQYPEEGYYQDKHQTMAVATVVEEKPMPPPSRLKAVATVVEEKPMPPPSRLKADPEFFHEMENGEKVSF